MAVAAYTLILTVVASIVILLARRAQLALAVYPLILAVVASIAILLARRTQLAPMLSVMIAASAGGVLFWFVLLDEGVAEGNLTPPIFCCFELIAILVSGVFGAAFRRRPPMPGHCMSCNYDLHGNESGTCPECGTPIKKQRPQKRRERP